MQAVSTALPVLVSTTTAAVTTFAGLAVGAAAGHAIGLLRGRRRPPDQQQGVSADHHVDEHLPVRIDDQMWSGDPRINRALGALPLGVVVTDPEGDVVYRNQFAEQFRGARHGNALVEAELSDLIRAASAGRGEERSVDIYGPPARSLQLRGSPTYDGEQLTGSVVVIEDVTAAHHVDRVRKDFVANVSHELRTPVGAIGVLAETLRDSRDPKVVERLAGRLQNEALRLGDMIEDLLTLSTLESGEISEPDLVDLHQVVRLAVDRSAGAAEQRAITIVQASQGDGPVFVDGDQGQMVSAVFNLLDNAIKYSDPGSDVVVSIERTDDTAVIGVADTGVGIPETQLDRIFERFYRVDGARSRGTGGTGLGLSIVRHVAMNHQGSISVRSAEGRGSTFELSLPLSDVHGPGPADPNSEESRHG